MPKQKGFVPNGPAGRGSVCYAVGDRTLHRVTVPLIEDSRNGAWLQCSTHLGTSKYRVRPFASVSNVKKSICHHAEAIEGGPSMSTRGFMKVDREISSRPLVTKQFKTTLLALKPMSGDTGQARNRLKLSHSAVGLWYYYQI